jgi:hypothetical protein
LTTYKNYWRKTGLKKPFGDFVLNHIGQFEVQNFLEVGVFCGVTARNVCELLNKKNSGNFKLIYLALKKKAMMMKSNLIF